MLNSLLAYNSPSNISRTVTDAGHNLSSDASYMLPGPGSASGLDPELGPLTDNGDPTLTLALLPGSPAIDAGDTIAAPATGQRGVPRPYGQAADIGAFEYWLTAKAMASPTGGVNIVAFGIPGQTCCLLNSSHLESWKPAAINQVGPDWTALFHDDAEGQPRRFYRLTLP